MVPLEVFRKLPKTLGTERYPVIWKLLTYLDHSEKAQDSRAEVLRRAAVILWDEASQISDVVLDCVDRLLRDLTRIAKPFGGKIIVMGNDFRQILPVVPGAREAGIIAHTVLQHYTMRDGTFRKYALTENIRLRLSAGEDTSHRDWLLRLGSGDLPIETNLHPQAVELPHHLCMPETKSVEAFVEWVFPDVRNRVAACLAGGNTSDADAWFSERAILTPKNQDATDVNHVILAYLDPATDFLALSIDTVADPEGEDSVNFPTEFLNSLTPSGLPPHDLHLRQGAIVIIIRNLDKDRGICNGVRCLVISISLRALDVRVLTVRAAGSRLLLPRTG